MSGLINFGRVWAILATSIVAINDASAYAAGMSFGMTPLIKLSPNKTLEGFLGGMVLTVIFIFWAQNYLLTKVFITGTHDSFTYKLFVP